VCVCVEGGRLQTFEIFYLSTDSLKIFITSILSVVLHGCDTWSLTVREEHRLKVFEKWMLRRIFGPKRDEVAGDWRKLHNEKVKE